MIHISLPTMNDIDIFRRCVRAYPGYFSEIDLNEMLPIIGKLYDDYHDLLTNARVVDLNRSEPFGKFTADIMKGFYTNQLVGKEGVCRDEYNKLLASAPRKKCPMCSESIVTSLDHHVPKQTYYSYAVNPKNLVPICSRCNEAKKNTMPNRVDKQFIHPYYDDFSNFSWFEMVFINNDPIEIMFCCKPNNHLNPEAQAKLKSHFSRLKLDELYASNAIVKLEDMKNTFLPFLATQDWEAVEEEIDNCLDMVSRRPDSWEYALYSRLLNERWYIEGGFNNIE
ncbi:HNH endonuclease [Cronobacter sakazakii]|nr:HNH endonuclease [Cronobacter sakazakii]